MINWHKALRLYFIAGTQDIHDGESIEQVLAEAINSGITCFQYREKGLNSLNDHQARLAQAKRLQLLCQSADIPFVVNDDVDLAIEIGADAIHVGQSDKPIAETIQLAKQYKMDVGLSVNTLEQLHTASQIEGLSYVGIGPIFPTNSKSDAEAPIGIDELARRAALYPELPKVAIGGIQINNAKEVLETDINGIAVISAVTTSAKRKQDINILLGN